MPKIAEVLWEDTVWEMDGDLSDFRLSQTVGYIVSEDDDHLWLCQEYDAFGDKKSVQRIPQSIVRSVLILAN